MRGEELTILLFPTEIWGRKHNNTPTNIYQMLISIRQNAPTQARSLLLHTSAISLAKKYMIVKLIEIVC